MKSGVHLLSGVLRTSVVMFVSCIFIIYLVMRLTLVSFAEYFKVYFF